MIPGSANPLLMAAAQDTGYNVSRSLRFNAPDSAYLIRTPSSNGTSYTTWTWSIWVKRSALGNQVIFSSGTNTTDYLIVNFQADDSLRFLTGETGPTNQNLVTTAAVFRDLSAWYHIVIQADFGNATQTDRIKIYVNGIRQTISGTIAAQNYAGTTFNRSGIAHNIGRQGNGVAYFSGYLAEIHFIDGQALTPSSFAETNATTGQWVPKAYTGSYGTNGFKLDFADNSAATAAALGKDTSGNGNNWTPTNLSVTAGAGNDSLVDTPVSSGTDTGAGGEVKGNYCTFNPLDNGSAVLANGNLDWDSIGNQGTRSTFFVSSGKWYWEITYNQANLIGEHGVATRETQVLTGGSAFPGAFATSWGFSNSSGNKSNNMSFTNITGAGAQNDVVMVALDMDNGKIWWGRNGTWLGSGNPATGANAAFSNLAGNTVAPMAGVGGADAGAVSYNFGARSWAYTAPSGFKALCDTSLPTPVVAKPSTVFQATLWSGNSTNNRSISGLEFSPDLVWIKNRSSSAAWNVLFDVVRGAGNQLATNQTDAELATGSNLAGRVGSFDSSGFTLVAGSGSSPYLSVNETNSAYVGWAWDAGSSTVTNTQGSITSSVRANASAGFSIVTYTGNGSAGATVGHGLGVTPGLVILKSRSLADSDWVVTHSAFANQTDNFLRLNTTGAVGTLSGVWSKTSTTFGFPTSYDGTNKNGSTYVAYCFAPVAGYSSFGSYTGNGSADGPFQWCGFRPRWLLVKATGAINENWVIIDALRSDSNLADDILWANLASSEFGNYGSGFDFTANGFKVRGTWSGNNSASSSYVWAAFAESPFQYARAR